MSNTEELKAALRALPFPERAAVLADVELSLLHDLERQNIALAQESLARLDAGVTKAMPWEEVRRKYFRHS